MSNKIDLEFNENFKGGTTGLGNFLLGNRAASTLVPNRSQPQISSYNVASDRNTGVPQTLTSSYNASYNYMPSTDTGVPPTPQTSSVNDASYNNMPSTDTGVPTPPQTSSYNASYNYVSSTDTGVPTPPQTSSYNASYNYETQEPSLPAPPPTSIQKNIVDLKAPQFNIDNNNVINKDGKNFVYYTQGSFYGSLMRNTFNIGTISTLKAKNLYDEAEDGGYQYLEYCDPLLEFLSENKKNTLEMLKHIHTMKKKKF